MKAMLSRIAAMLTRMAMKFDGVAEPVSAYEADIDYDNEHRYVEHEHEVHAEELPAGAMGARHFMQATWLGRRGAAVSRPVDGEAIGQWGG